MINELNKKLMIGQIILGALSHYDNEEIIEHKALQHVALQLKKKHFDLKNGAAIDRFNSKKPRNEKILKKALENIHNAQKSWNEHSNVANKAWVRSRDEVTIGITISDLINAILRKRPDVVKYYGFNKKKMKGYGAESHLFGSSKVATILLNNLDIEYAYWINNESEG